MRIHQITFSPTGGTKKVADALRIGFGTETTVTDLCLKEEHITLPKIATDDFVVIAMPVFAGRVPALAVERLRRIASNHAMCVIVAVYGNRAYDDALLEMQDVATGMGFRVIAAIGAIAEHSIARTYATGRPDAEDCEVLAGYAAEIMRKIEANGDFTPLSLPGNRPYRPSNVGPFPEANDQCNNCGTCASLCPANAIPTDNIHCVDKNACISCMRCVSVCPTKARGVGPVVTMVTEKLRPLCTARKSNELFI